MRIENTHRYFVKADIRSIELNSFVMTGEI
jgi:hypothetical protein